MMDYEKLYPNENLGAKNGPRKYNRWFSVCYALTITLGSFQYGYSFCTYNVVAQALNVQLSITAGDSYDSYFAWITTMLPIGAAVGALSAVFVVFKFGRKWPMVGANLIYIIGCGITLAKNTGCLFAGRVVEGVGVGFFTVLCPLWVREISPTELHPYTGTLVMLQITGGQMLAYLLGMMVPGKGSDIQDTNTWKAIFAIPMGVAAIQIGLHLFLFRFDSPKYLFTSGKTGLSEKALKQIYTDPDRVQSEIVEMEGEAERNNPEDRATFNRMLRTNTKALMFGITLSFFQQFSGISAIYLYSNLIFHAPGDTYMEAKTATMVLGLVNFGACAASFFTIQRIGRKWLLVGGFACMGVCLMIAAICEYKEATTASDIFAIVLVGIYQLSVGPALWVYLPEILPEEKGLALTSGTNWIILIMVSIFSPYLIINNDIKRGGFYLFFMAFQFLGTIFGFILPETKDRSTTEVQRELGTSG